MRWRTKIDKYQVCLPLPSHHIILILFFLREVGTEDLVTFTSSKKTPPTPATEAEPAETTKDTSTDSKHEAAVESEFKETESPPSNNSAKSYSSPL